MFWFQELVREYTTKPVLLSSLVQLPSITCSLGRNDQVRLLSCTAESPIGTTVGRLVLAMHAGPVLHPIRL